MPRSGEPMVPFRWDLITPDQLGTLVDGVARPGLWFIDDLADCAGKVLARSGNGDLIFVGRSLDSMFDLLGGVLEGTSWSRRAHRLPVSFAVPGRMVGKRWQSVRISPAQTAQARHMLADLGLSPHALARRDHPVTFVDVVDVGGTFTKLYHLLRSWIDDEREPWSVVRRRLRFIGVTIRMKTSPKTFRWQQAADWTRDLPARSVLNVSLDRFAWSYFAGGQTKLTDTFRPDRWLAEIDGPSRGDEVSQALAEALAVVAYGRTRTARSRLVQAMTTEPAIAEPWLRQLVGELGRTPATAD